MRNNGPDRDLHRKGTTPRRRRLCCAQALKVVPGAHEDRYRVIDSLVNPRRTAMPPYSSFSSSSSFPPFSRSPPLFPHRFLFPAPDTIFQPIANPLVLFIFYHYHIRFSSDSSSPFSSSISSFIKYSCVDAQPATHIPTQDHRFYARAREIVTMRRRFDRSSCAILFYELSHSFD